ncbi:MAG: NAD-dependent epimerase/dehydratase family protein [Acidobacteriota bacterium]|nr:MAG: NAD-dependent epimerase/dehydratase family protein [Acidobacteriota bacterium]
MKKILVTGGTGFLGRRLLEKLAARGDVPVRAMVRDPARADFSRNVEVVRGDMLEPMTIDAALEGVSRVFHCASLVKVWVKDEALFDRVNVEGFAHLLRYARARGVERVLYTSSFMALGPTDGKTADEETPYPSEHRPRGGYERTKFIAEALARQAVRDGLDLRSVYPGVIYGPGPMTDANLLGGILLRFFRKKLPGIVGPGDRRWCCAYVEDVVEGMLRAMERGAAGGRYILGGENRTLAEVFRLVKAWTGRKPPRRIPYFLADLVGYAKWARAEIFKKPPDLVPSVVEIFRHEWAYESARARRELDYRVTPFEEGLRRTLEWLRDAHDLPFSLAPAAPSSQSR